jgi:hypothetical protein
MNKIYEIIFDYLLQPSKFHLLHELSKVLKEQKFQSSSEIFQKIYESKNSNNSKKLQDD